MAVHALFVGQQRAAGPSLVKTRRSFNAVRHFGTTQEMLAKEKRRALWSLAVGVVLAAATCAYGIIVLRRMDSKLGRAVKVCWASPSKDGHPVARATNVKTGRPEEIVLDEILKCSPADLKDAEADQLIPPERRVREIIDAKENKRSNLTLFAGGVITISVLPFLWYFLLDRIREVSAAISGRDRTP